jgi:hypothetical protein
MANGPGGVEMKKIFAVCAIVIVSGCSQDPATAPSTETDPTAQVDTDPTPQTGTGGPSQSADPDTTTNGAPGAKPMESHPTPTE